MIERIAAACMPPCSPAPWFHPGATALLLVDLLQGTCGDAQPRPSPDFDRRFRATTLPADFAGEIDSLFG